VALFRATMEQCFSTLVWCTCLWRHDAYAHVVWCLWCMLARLGYPQNELVVERTITGWEGVGVASRILTTMIPSAHLVAVMWLQRTWCPRFRRGTFGYGTTTSPNIREILWVGKFPCECTLVHPRFPNAHAMQMHAQEGTYLLIYLFIKRLWARPWGIRSGLKVRRNQDKDINTKIILVLHMFKDKGVGGEYKSMEITCWQEKTPLKIEF
jgi:hypothetical protein